MRDNDARPAHPFNPFRHFASTRTGCVVSWWTEAERQDFYDRCRIEWRTRMAGSEGERAVSRIHRDRVTEAWEQTL